MVKSLKNVGGSLTYFRLGPKTKIGCWDLRFSVRSKILAFCGTLLREVLILVPNQNCAKKNCARFLPGLEITSLKIGCKTWKSDFEGNLTHMNLKAKVFLKISRVCCSSILLERSPTFEGDRFSWLRDLWTSQLFSVTMWEE